jgi:hypothetical protein
MLKSFLGVFFTVIVKLSCSYTPSIHELLHHLYRISKVNYLFFFNLIHFNIYLFSISFFYIRFFYLIFFYIFFSNVRKYRKSRRLSFSNRRSNERKFSQILGGSTRRDNYCKLSPSIIQEKIHHKASSKVQIKSTSTH